MKNRLILCVSCMLILMQTCLVLPLEIGQEIQPDFIASMASWGKYGRFDKQAAVHDEYTSVAIKLYNDFWVNAVRPGTQPSIPKIIHQIWLGSPLPEKYKQFQQSWKLYHPDWQYLLWTEKEIEEFGLVNINLFRASKNYGQKADIARYEILYRIGGLYVDTDFECLRPFDVLHDCGLDFYTSCLPEASGSLNKSLLNGLVASRPGHPILKACVDGLKKASLAYNKLFEETGTHYFTEKVFTNLASAGGRSVIFPVSFFYPLPNFYASHYISQADAKKQFVRDESFAIHWWACSWVQ